MLPLTIIIISKNGICLITYNILLASRLDSMMFEMCVSLVLNFQFLRDALLNSLFHCDGILLL